MAHDPSTVESITSEATEAAAAAPQRKHCLITDDDGEGAGQVSL